MTNRLSDHRELLGVLAGLLLVVFIGPVFLNYGIHNDYSTLSYPHNRCCLQYPETVHLFMIGRPIGGVLLNLHLLPMHSIGSFAWGRFGSFIVLIISILISAQLFAKRIGLTGMQALLIATLLFLLPSALLFVIWLTNFVPGTLNVLLATISYYFVARSYDGGKPRAAVLGYCLLFLTFFIYPPTSYWFLIFTCAKVLFSKSEEWIRRRLEVVVELACCIGLSSLYFLVAKVTTPLLTRWAFGSYLPEHGTYDFALAGGLSTRLEVLKHYLAFASAVWFPGFLPPALLVVISLVALVAASALERATTGVVRVRRDAWQRVGLVTGIILLTSAPVVASSGGFVALRTVCVTAGIFALLWAGSIVQLCGASRYGAGAALLFSLLVVGAAVAAVRLNLAAFNAHLEIEYIRRRVAAFDGTVKRILLRTPERYDVIVNGPLTIEFGYMATNYFPLTDTVKVAMEERGLKSNDVTVSAVPPEIVLTAEFRSEFTVTEDPGLRMIDMADAGFRRTSTEAQKRPLIAISQKPLSGCCSAAFAFDLDPNTFFEEDRGFPAELNLTTRDACQNVIEYSFASHVLSNRMPLAWKVYGRAEEGGDWELLDSRQRVPAWNDFEQRVFSIANSACFGQYKIVFSKGGDPQLLRIGKIGFKGNLFRFVKARGATGGLTTDRISASCTLEPYGPAGVLQAEVPGWHCRSPRYPEWLRFDFGAPVRFSRLALLPQYLLADRAPKDIVVEESKDGKVWQPILQATSSCTGGPEEWRALPLNKPVSVSHVRLKFLSNCGAPDLLTLRGVRFE